MTGTCPNYPDVFMTGYAKKHSQKKEQGKKREKGYSVIYSIMWDTTSRLKMSWSLQITLLGMHKFMSARTR